VRAVRHSIPGPNDLNNDQKGFLGEHTLLWFYMLREAELNNGRLTRDRGV